jgi:hypothetical protein
MAERKILLLLLATLLFLPLLACTDSGKEKGPVFKKLPGISEIKPQKPVKIKLKKNASGSYSWEVTGNDADEIIEADKKLRKAIEK